MHDYILWYARSKESLKFRRLFTFMDVQGDTHWNFIEFPNGEIRQLKPEEINNHGLIPKEASIFRFGAMFSAGVNDSGFYDIKVDGDIYKYPAGKGWKTPIDSMKKLITLKRVMPWEKGKTLGYKIKLSDYPVTSIDTVWDDTALLSNKSYVVQTSTIAIQKCLLMTTDPGDLVIDPTCGSGTTAYVAEQWGRRWITMDTSRVPLALARQRLLTATYDYFQLKDETLGPAGGFVYKRKQNNKGEEVGGIVPHLTLGAIANNEPPKEEILVDKPEKDNSITRVTGPFCFEATIPTPVDLEGGEENAIDMEEHGSFVDRMLEVLRRSPVLQVGGGKIVTFKNVRPPAKTLSLSAEAIVGNGSDKTIAIVFGPENGAVSERTALEALKEAHLKNYSHLYVIGFSIQANARVLIEKSSEMGMLSSTYIQATPDIMMGDLLKNMRSSQIFSVCGMPEIKIHKVKTEKNAPQKYQVELLGLDVFDPGTMETLHRKGDDVPMWMLDTDHNGLSFHVCQAFFPRTSAWDNLKKSLKMTYEESVWDHLAGSISAPFEAGEHEQISVKVIDDRGNELVVVKAIKEAGK
jgi:adenine-specific DNA-methyltransferase